MESLHPPEWKADDLSWLWDEQPEDVKINQEHITPDGARAELERVQLQWRWEDLGLIERPDQEDEDKNDTEQERTLSKVPG